MTQQKANHIKVLNDTISRLQYDINDLEYTNNITVYEPNVILILLMNVDHVSFMSVAIMMIHDL